MAQSSPNPSIAPESNLLRAVFFTVAAVVLASVIATYLMGQAVLASARQVAWNEALIRHVKETESLMKDAETGQRGFLLTGEEPYLAPYDEAHSAIDGALAGLDKFVGDEGISADAVQKFRSLATAKLAELDQTIQARREKSFSAAAELVRTDIGKHYMDDLRALTASTLDLQSARLTQLQERTNRLTAGRTIICAAAAATNLGCLIWAYKRLRSESRARERAAAELRSQKELLAVTLSSIGDGVIVTDAQANITFINSVGAELSGWPDADAIGKPCTQVFNIINEDSRQRVESPVEKVLRLGTVVGLANHTLLIRRDGSEIPIDDSGAPIRDLQGQVRGVVLVFRDFTEHKANAAKLIKAREDAEAANIAKDNFLATLSHELRTPLTPVAVTLAHLEGNGDLPAAFQSDVQMMRRNIDLEARLIDDLLDLTRIVRGKLSLNLEVADLHTLVDSVVNMSQSEFNARQLRLTAHLAAARHHVRVDPARLQQVLLNVLKNASKFTPAGGTVDVRTQDVEGQIRVSITDSGIGMSADMLTRLFRPFEQGTAETVRRYGGLGLGMSISKALMESQGGSITAASEGLSRGSTFTITLPSTAAPAAPAPTPQPSVPSTAQRQLKILIVEDHEDTGRVMTRLLEKQGHAVRLAGSVAAGVEAFGQQTFDLLLSDIGLPDGTGIDLIRIIRQQSPIPAIALTGYGMEEDVAKCIAAGFDDHLTKPVNLQRLQAAIALAAKRAS